MQSPARNTSQPWAVARISKPRSIAAETAVPTQPIVDTTVPHTQPPVTSATPAPALGPSANEDTGSSEAAGSPLITMVIVDEAPQTASGQETSPPAASTGKYVLVSISEQHLYAYENGQLVYSFIASTGMGNSTRVGTFSILDKIPNAYGENWDIWMPNWLGIYWSGTLENGIHALPILPGGGRLWAGYLGTPISYGCVVLGVDEALQLYDWAEVGTPVEIRW